MSDLVGNPEDLFSDVAAHLYMYPFMFYRNAKGGDGKANSVEPDQTASPVAV